MKKVLCLLIILLISTGCQNEVVNDVPKNKNAIKEINFESDNIVALTYNNEIYVIGDASYGIGVSKDIDVVVEPTKVAENVKQFYGSTCYIDSNDDLYYTGISIQGGVDHEFVKLRSNVKSVEACSFACVIVLDDNNTSYAITNHFNTSWMCGLPREQYEEFNELATNVKQAIGLSFANSYINSNDELFMIDAFSVDKNNPVYTKVADNVKKISNSWALTKDNVLYSYYDGSLEKIADNVVDINNSIFESQDGYFYFSNYENDLLVASDAKGYYRLKFDNVERLLYADVGKYIYLNDENKIEMYTEYDHYVLDNDVSSMTKMLEFISN